MDPTEEPSKDPEIPEESLAQDLIIVEEDGTETTRPPGPGFLD